MSTNICAGRKCRSVGDARQTVARGLCRNCYNRAWRHGDFKGQRVAETENLQAFLEANQYNVRRDHVRRLMDGGLGLVQIVQHFLDDEELNALLRDAEAPLTVLKRDMAHWHNKDKDTPAPIRALERQARYINEAIRDPATSVSARLSLIRELGKVEDALAKLRGQVRHVPGFGRELAEDEEPDAEPWARHDARMAEMMGDADD